MKKYKQPCVYLIQNISSGSFYIGSSKHGLNHRWKQHLTSLNKGNHHCILLQRSFNKEGLNNFSVLLLETVETPEKLLSVEQEWLDTFYSWPKCLNVLPHALGYRNQTQNLKADPKFSDLRTRLSNSKLGELNPMYGKEFSKIHLLRLSEVRMGEGNHAYGKPRTEETKDKISKTKKGQPSWRKGHENETRYYELLAPDGSIHKGTTKTDLRKLIKLYGLQRASIYRVLKGDAKQHIGWTKIKYEWIKNCDIASVLPSTEDGEICS